MGRRKKDFLSEMEYIDGITIIDTSGTILFSVKFNPRFHPEIVDDEEVIGKKLFEVFTNLDQESSTLTKAMELAKPINKKRQTIQDVSGTKIDTMNCSLPIKTNGRVIGAIEISKDITKYKEQSNDVLELDLNSQWFDNRNVMAEHLGPDKARYTLDDIVTNNSEMKQLKFFIKRIASGMAPVFIHGETGTGKELFAHAIHNASDRAKAPFITQNCAAIPENLLESILFGTTKGSFTGAHDQPGLFEVAEGGTIFLDEINSMPLNLQAKLLRVLQDGYVRRLGDSKERRVNTRIISASNASPKKCVKEGYLRQDIYYRLCVLDIHIPPLRERKEDIPLLLNFFIKKYNQSLDKNINNVSKDVYHFLANYTWPGNIRELEHLIEYAMNIIDKSDDTIEIEHIEHRLREMAEIEQEEVSLTIQPLKEVISKIEKTLITKAIKETEGNVSAAARLLEIPRQTLQRKLQDYKII